MGSKKIEGGPKFFFDTPNLFFRGGQTKFVGGGLTKMGRGFYFLDEFKQKIGVEGGGEGVFLIFWVKKKPWKVGQATPKILFFYNVF